MGREELAAWLRLTLTPGVGVETALHLLSAFGPPASVFAQSTCALRGVVSPTLAAALGQEPPTLAALLETTWRWLNTDKAPLWHRIVALGDPCYPCALLSIDGPPLMLYLIGAGDLVTAVQRLQHCVAVVGSRNPTPQGEANARQLSLALAQAGWVVVSGLALGVDGAAHEGALASLAPGSSDLVTVAVVGTGLDRVYPRAHRDLAHRIATNGLLISEYPLGTPPLAANFPRRNRLIAGLAQGTLVVEAALKSGSLITAQLTVEQGKDVFAIPGSIHSPQARGCHALIKQGAKLVESAQDILDELRFDSSTLLPVKPCQDVDNMSGLAHIDGANAALLAALGYDPVGLDVLLLRSGLDTPSLQAQLMGLELDGRVARLPGGMFQRVVNV